MTGSGIEPGRPKIEDRAAAYIWVGSRILDDDGLEWTVTQTEIADKRVTLHLSRQVGDKTHSTRMTVNEGLYLRVRNEDHSA